MTMIPNVPTNTAHIVDATPNILADFPVGGADPDFVMAESTKPVICAVPIVGKMFRQCK